MEPKQTPPEETTLPLIEVDFPVIYREVDTHATRVVQRKMSVPVAPNTFIFSRGNAEEPVEDELGRWVMIGQAFFNQDGVILENHTLDHLHQKWFVYFDWCMQHFQTAGTTGGRMSSTVHGHMRRGDDFAQENVIGFQFAVRHEQFSHERYEDTVLDVEFPEPLRSKVLYGPFREYAESYYRRAVGPLLMPGATYNQNRYVTTGFIALDALDSLQDASSW